MIGVTKNSSHGIYRNKGLLRKTSHAHTLTAQHDFIIARMENMGRLQEVVGVHQVMALVVEALERAED